MATGAKDVWVFQIVHQDTGKPAQGVPVTVLDASGNALPGNVSPAVVSHARRITYWCPL